MDIKIRTATVEDAEKLLEIYAYYIKNTAVTFEYEVPSVEEFRERISHILEHYPYFVAENTCPSSAVVTVATRSPSAYQSVP